MAKRKSRRKGRTPSIGASGSAPNTSGDKAARKLFCCLRYPNLAIGQSIRFQSGFFQTDSAEKQRIVEGSDEYELTVRDITDLPALPDRARRTGSRKPLRQ